MRSAKIDYGQEYEKNKEYINEILRVAKGPNGEVDHELLTEAQINTLKELYER